MNKRELTLNITRSWLSGFEHNSNRSSKLFKHNSNMIWTWPFYMIQIWSKLDLNVHWAWCNHDSNMTWTWRLTMLNMNVTSSGVKIVWTWFTYSLSSEHHRNWTSTWCKRGFRRVLKRIKTRSSQNVAMI